MEAGEYRILRTDTNGIRQYLLFQGRTTMGKQAKLLGGFDDPIGAQMHADNHSIQNLESHI